MDLFLNAEEDQVAFLSIDDVHFAHDRALLLGGRTGLISAGAIESGLRRADNVHAYGGVSDLITLAAYIWHGISDAHGYVDGNKRTALHCALTFLMVNGIELDQSTSSIEPGLYADLLYNEDRFTVEALDTYLRARARWIEEI
jgi:death-on-curing protein